MTNKYQNPKLKPRSSLVIEISILRFIWNCLHRLLTVDLLIFGTWTKKTQILSFLFQKFNQSGSRLGAVADAVFGVLIHLGKS